MKYDCVYKDDDCIFMDILEGDSEGCPLSYSDCSNFRLSGGKKKKKKQEKVDTPTVDTISLGAPFDGVVTVDAPVTGIVMKKDPDWPTVDIHVSKEIWDRIAAPNHYVDCRKYEPSKVAYDWGLDFNCGSALKYISRLGRKKGATYEEDICKAIRFLTLELECMSENKQ